MADHKKHETPKILTRGAQPEDGTAKSEGQKASKKKPHLHITDDRDAMVRVVQATFPQDGGPPYRPAREVARELGLTPQAVTALLQKAAEKRLFSTLRHLPGETADVARLEGLVKAKFDLKKVLLVPGLPEILDKLDRTRRRGLHLEVIRAMAVRVAAHLDSLIADAKRERGGHEKAFVLGVAWGRTMHLIAKHLLSTPRQTRLRGLQVLPIVGITDAFNPDPVEANVIAMDIARAYGGVSAQLPCSAFMPSGEASAAMQPEQVQQTLVQLKSCNAVITGMGPIPKNVDAAADITLSSDPRMNHDLFESAQEADAVGDICYWLFDREGKQVVTSYTAIGLGFDGLRRIAQDPNRQVILVAGGDRRRFEALRGALRTGLVSVLVSDTVTARYLAGEIEHLDDDLP